jgi:fatty acid/phospholipid biosynthesis enzyme
MTAADEMGFDNQFEEQLRAVVKEASLQQPRLVEDLHGSEDVQTLLSRHLDQETSERTAINYRLQAIESRLQAIESAIKRRRSRGIVRYLVAIGIGVAATVGWQSYGETTKQVIATKAPELSWSPEAKQMIIGWMQQLGWTKQSSSPESTAGPSSVPDRP